MYHAVYHNSVSYYRVPCTFLRNPLSSFSLLISHGGVSFMIPYHDHVIKLPTVLSLLSTLDRRPSVATTHYSNFNTFHYFKKNLYSRQSDIDETNRAYATQMSDTFTMARYCIRRYLLR